MLKKVDAVYMKVTLIMTMALMAVTAALPVNVMAAESTDAFLNGAKGVGDSGKLAVSWPWTRFLNSLANELTGPLPLVLGLLGVSCAAVALLFGNGGSGTQKALLLIGAVSVAMFTPTLVMYIYESASGATIDMVISAASTIAPPPLP